MTRVAPERNIGMELKTAVSVCLISLFSATLVVLIARSLDSQAATRLEPQLAEHRRGASGLRSQGGLPPAGTLQTKAETVSDGLIVYYFHGNIRCPTCRSIESQAQETVQTHFASQLSNGEMAWKIVNYEQPAAKPLATKFAIQMPVVVLARMKDGRCRIGSDWTRSGRWWATSPLSPSTCEERLTECFRSAEAKPRRRRHRGQRFPFRVPEALLRKERLPIPIPQE